MYFSYHKKIIDKIKNDELKFFEFVDEYNSISPCLVLYFNDGTKYPIREHRFDEYVKLLEIYIVK